ncbi:PD-(D/E)XK nuclease family protein [Maribacter sp.]|uniref:PDDEXK-like family protein n=1 Tax=Maribacter sp. TaxID=1897614 RepID=UPI003296DFC2
MSQMSYKELLKNIDEISKKFEELEKVSGEAFNIFKVINVTSDEVRLHSKFLAELLNRNGSHGQGDVFLKLFVKQLGILLDTSSATVKVEKYIGKITDSSGGYIDIFISDNKGQSITIENKIYAGDQNNQLLRYFNFNPNNILYLTLWGDAPEDYSSSGLIIDEEFKRISYKEDIIDWLVGCRKEAVELPLLREAISHYINLIQLLTGQTGTTKMNKEVKEYIASSSETLKQAALIADNMNDAKVLIQWSFWESLKEKLEAEGLTFLDKKKVTWENVNGFYNKARNKDVYFGFWVKIFEENNTSIHFGVELHEDIYFGFTAEKKGVGGVSNLVEFNKFKNMVAEINSNYTNNEWWLGWRFTEEKLNFRAFNTQAVFDLADEKKLDEKTNAIAEDIIKDINEMKKALEVNFIV